MPESPGVFLPFVTFVLGFGAKWITDWSQSRWASKREREARQEARRDLLQQRRSDFQRENLLEVQEACMKLMRATAQAHLFDVQAYRDTGQWQKMLMPDDLDEALRLLTATLVTHAVRIQDDEIRRLAYELRSASAQVGHSASREESEARMNLMGAVHETLNERVGLVLRTLDELDDQNA